MTDRRTPSAAYTASDVLPGKREPLDWFIEVCGVCGCQLGPGIGSRTRTGRCVYEEHRQVGGVVVRVTALPGPTQNVSAERTLERIGRA